MATIKDVAKLAKVSISTVSRVINDTARVVPEKREAVLAAMQALSFQPNSFAQALVKKRSNCIGVLVGDLCGGPFFAQMMRGIERVVERDNKFTIMMSGNHDEHRERQGIQALLQRQCDGLIVHAMALPDEELLALTKLDTPVVFINRRVPGAEEHCIWLDNQEGARLAVRHLVAQGHSRIAYITFDNPGFIDAQHRLAGYQQGLVEAGLSADEQLLVGAFPDEIGGHVAMGKLLARQVPFSAVLCFNDAMAVGALSWLAEQGYRVPAQISVMGFDDIPYVRFIHPKLTTVRYPIERMGAQAAELAVQLLNHGALDGMSHKFAPELQIRESVCAPAVESPAHRD